MTPMETEESLNKRIFFIITRAAISALQVSCIQYTAWNNIHLPSLIINIRLRYRLGVERLANEFKFVLLNPLNILRNLRKPHLITRLGAAELTVSIDFGTIYLMMTTSCVWPILCTRSTACASAIGFQ
jgi:hypothetical protein